MVLAVLQLEALVVPLQVVRLTILPRPSLLPAPTLLLSQGQLLLPTLFLVVELAVELVDREVPVVLAVLEARVVQVAQGAQALAMLAQGAQVVLAVTLELEELVAQVVLAPMDSALQSRSSPQPPRSPPSTW
jgi:hypothetical protein